MTIWQDLRESTDDALKHFAMLPGVVEMDNDSLETIAALSSALRNVDTFVNELGIRLNGDGDGPEDSTVTKLERITRNGGRTDG